MLEWTLYNHICRLVDASAIWRDVEDMNLRKIVFHSLFDFFGMYMFKQLINQIISCILGKPKRVISNRR